MENAEVEEDAIMDTFFPGILISSDYNGILILPEIQNTLFILTVEE